MCKGGKKKTTTCEKTAEAKTEDETEKKVRDAKEAERIAKFKANLAARSPPTVYRPDESSKRALDKIPEIAPVNSSKS